MEGSLKNNLIKFKNFSLVLIIGWILDFNPVLAASSTAGVGQISSFIKSIIQIMAGLAGLVATGYFIVGGFSYITSSGHPQKLEKAKRTILYSAVGLAITIGAFVLSNIVGSLATNAFGG